MLVYYNGDSLFCNGTDVSNDTSVQYNSSECQSILATQDGYLWEATLNHITTKNQILVLYGYVNPGHRDNPLWGQQFDLIYSLYINGRNNETTEWESIIGDKNGTQSVDCRDKENLQVCNQYLLAHIPLIQYNYYQFKLYIYNSDIVHEEIEHFHFKVAYVDENFTKIHFIVRAVFLILSLMATLIYLCKICRINRNARKTYDQKVLQIIVITLVFFNDPFFIANLFKPTFMLYIFSQLFTALFFGILLFYWLRTIEKVKDSQHEGVKSQTERQVKGQRGKSPLEIVKAVFFVIFIIDVMALYVIYLFNVKDDPSYTHFQKIPKLVLGLVITTAILMGIYLVWFAINIFMTIIFFCRISARSRVMFLLSIFMVLICVATLILGVYSPFYKDGGVFMFFIGVFNIYVYSLIFLTWPTSLFEELQIDDQPGESDRKQKQKAYQYQKERGPSQTEEESKEHSQIGIGQRDIKIEF